MFENSKEIMRKIKNKEGLTDAEFTTVERCLLLDDVDDKILNYQSGVKMGAIDAHFRQDKIEFEKTDKIINQIRNKEELSKPDRMTWSELYGYTIYLNPFLITSAERMKKILLRLVNRFNRRKQICVYS